MTEPHIKGRLRGRRAVTTLRWVAFGLLALIGGALLLFMLVLALFTDPAPRPLPAIQLSDAELNDLENRLADFQQALRQEHNPGPLVLRSPEINALLVTLPGTSPLRDHLRLDIRTNALWAQFSFPLSQVSGVMGRILSRRFLNANAHLTVTVRQGVLDVRLLDLRVRGRGVPRWLTAPARRKNIAQSVNDNARAAMALEKIGRVEVERDCLRIYPIRFGEASR